MLSQLQNIQSRIVTDMGDVFDWAKHVRPDPERPTTGDAAYVIVATEFNRYAMSVLSAYIEPPAGAPYQCKALGTVTFDDHAANKHIVGPKADETWMAISRHVHVRELTDAIAAARREMAEAGPERAQEIRGQLVVLAERGKKWGVEVKGLAPPMMIVTPEMEKELDAAAMASSAITYAKEALAPTYTNISFDGGASGIGVPIDGTPDIHPGARIYFITNPGEEISGMQELPGLCVKVYPDQSISAFVTPDHSEPFYRDRLPKRSAAHAFNCWDFNPADVRMVARLRQLEETIETHRRELERLAALSASAKLISDAPKEPAPAARKGKTRAA